MNQGALHNRLGYAKWFFFDLDDTLHSFRKASFTAATATLRLVITKASQNASITFTLSNLRMSYATILQSQTQAAFVDGKTSHEYREDRFRLLLDKHRVDLSDLDMKELLECYESTLVANLELKPGALSLLQTLEARDKKIAIITEGPQDAQERTIAALGLTQYLDYLATTNKHGVAKIDGLFSCVLTALGIKSEEVVMVGDSLERDIAPAKDAGITCVWYNEKGDRLPKAGDGVIRIGSLQELEGLVGNI